MAAIPVRLPPLPGEALDSWLETYAHLLHVTVRDIFDFAGIDWGRVNGDQRTGKPWLCQLDEPDLAALSAATGVPPQTLAGMTLARYQGTGLAEATAQPGMRRTPRWWRQLSGSRYCPRCLAANGGRWMLAWRIPWAFACTSCQVLLADTCPGCGRRHRRTRTGQPRQPGHCDLTGLPLPPWHPPRGGTSSCTSDPAGTPAAALPAGGHVLAAQQHTDAIIATLLASRGRPAETAALRQYLDDACAVARAAVSAVNGTAGPPAAAIAALEELGARPGPGAAESALASPPGGPPRQLAPVTAFGVTIADIMLHGRPDDPDPVIAGWLAGNTASRRNTTSPADVLIHWDRASPALQAALARPLAARLDTFYQLRYRAVAGPARIPDPARARERAAALPSLLWPGWALRLMPPGALRLPALPGRARDDARRRGDRRGGLPHRPGAPRPGARSTPAGWPPSPPGSARTASWNRSLPRSASSPANSTSTAPRSTTPADGGCAASPRPGSTPPPGAASATSSPTPPPGRSAATSTTPASPPPRCRSSSPGSA